MYLSRLILNPRSRQVRRDLQMPYEMHRTIMRAFGPKDAEPGRVLWRVDQEPRENRITLYVQSAAVPDWRPLCGTHPDYCLDAEAAGVDHNPSPPADLSGLQLKTGQVLAFRLRANPTVKRKVDGKKNGVRLGLVGDDAQVEWLRRKGSTGGFQVLDAAVRCEDDPRDLAKGIKQRASGEERMSLLSVRYEGRLSVTDPESFLNTLCSGVGSGKAFGFGLLSLARV